MTQYRLQISNDYSKGAKYYFAGPFNIPAKGQTDQQINIEQEYIKSSEKLDKDDIKKFIEVLKQTLQESKYAESYNNKLKLLSDESSVFVFVKDVGEHKDNEIFFTPKNTKIMEVAHIDEEDPNFVMNRLYIMKQEDIQLGTPIYFTNVNRPDKRPCLLKKQKIQIF